MFICLMFELQLPQPFEIVQKITKVYEQISYNSILIHFLINTIYITSLNWVFIIYI